MKPGRQEAAKEEIIMSNWVSVTIDDLKAGKRGEIVDMAGSVSTGGADPVAESIADAVSRVRGAISQGNRMDVDTSKVPRSVRGLCVRIAIRALKDRIQLPLTEDERGQRAEDISYLNRIADQKVRFEEPDTPKGSSEMQSRGAQYVKHGKSEVSRKGLRGL